MVILKKRGPVSALKFCIFEFASLMQRLIIPGAGYDKATLRQKAAGTYAQPFAKTKSKSMNRAITNLRIAFSCSIIYAASARGLSSPHRTVLAARSCFQSWFERPAPWTKVVAPVADQMQARGTVGHLQLESMLASPYYPAASALASA